MSAARAFVRRISRLAPVAVSLVASFAALGATPAPPGATATKPALGPDVVPYVAVSDPVVVLRHVRVVDGTGAPAREDQTVVLAEGRIAAIGPTGSTPVPDGARTFDLAGHTVIPGLVGMHEHLFYTAAAAPQMRGGEPGFFVDEIAWTAPRLYLASGVTTLRTTGSVEPYADLKVKQRVAAGLLAGPAIEATAPYLEGRNSPFAQMRELAGPEDAQRMVAHWAGEGMTSFKAYMNIRRDELAAAAAEAHRLKLKVTGHLCSVTWREAIAAGIDNLEHGPVFTATDFVADKQPDLCPPGSARTASWEGREVDSPEVQSLIADLVAHGVAVTSTLPVFELNVAGRPPLAQRVLDAMAPDARLSYLTVRSGLGGPGGRPSLPEATLRKEMAFELAFARAGGLLLAGSDPTGIGGVLPGFGSQREVELLVEAGFTPLEAISIATANGARYLGRDDIGVLAPGKRADLVVLDGDPSTTIADIEKVTIVYKDGVGYDPAKLLAAVRGQVGIR